LRDYIGFGSKLAPTAFENGLYGVMGVDDHSVGKPSVGTHISVENNTLNNVDLYDGTPYVAGAQRYRLGNLANGQNATFQLMLSVRTGTVINQSGPCNGSANGGSSAPGGVDFAFENVTEPGDFFAEYSQADADEIAQRVLAGEFTFPTFAIPGLMQLYEIEFEGQFNGDVLLTFGYDPLAFSTDVDLQMLKVFHFSNGQWEAMETTVYPLSNKIEFTTSQLSPFAIGMVPEPGVALAAGIALLVFRRRAGRR
jgi:hypothetical protein